MLKKFFLLFVVCVGLGSAMAETNMKTASLPPHIEFRNFGVYGILEYSHLFSLTNFEDLPEFNGFNGYTAILGFQIRKETAIGLGYTYLLDKTGAFSQMPVFVELRSHLTRNRLSPFTALSFGYSFPTGSFSGGQNAVNIEKGGVNFGLKFGGRFAITRHVGASLHVGYTMLSMRSIRVCDAPLVAAYEEPLLLHNLSLGLSLNF